MATITTLRPSSTVSGVDWLAQPAGTLDGVTSDNSDATYALWQGNGSPMILGTPPDSPPVGERRHQVRLRARGEDGDAWWSVRLSNGLLTAGAAAQFSASPATVTGSWGTGAPPDGSTVLYAYVSGQSAGLKINELYLDVDSRTAPTFDPEILDGSGTPSVVIADTSQPIVRADSVDLDDLAARQYRYWVTQGATIVWDTGIVSGAAVNRATDPLDNGSYTAHLQVWSTLGANLAYASDEETIAFTVAVGLVPQPDNPTVTPDPDSPFFSVEVCAPYTGDFDDDQGWIEIQRVDCAGVLTTVAVVGPLETGECDTFTDFSMPRAGMGASCDHIPEECCSYYRARTVGRIDGDLRISNWSDGFNPGVPNGAIVMWPDTAASIPDGWDRVTALDARYPKGIPNSSTAPGTTGGDAFHQHGTALHAHDVSHSHTTPTPTAAATGTVNAPNTAGALKVLTSHTHSRPSTDSATVASSSSAPGTDTENNDPARLEVIFIESDGSPLGVPDGALGMTLDTSVSGWTDYANATNRFLKGAAAAGNGGATAASTLDSHVHAVNAHAHSVGTNHTHTSANTGSASSTLAPATGSGSVLSAATHTHPITVASATTAALASGSPGNSGASGALDPPYRNLRVKENTSGAPDLPVGLICAWRGSLGSIPGNWQLCDGTNGTPNMFGLYPRGATASINGTGGSLTAHSHTGPSHTHTTSGHSHTSTTGAATTGSTTASTTATVAIATTTHTHVLSDTNSATPTVGSSSGSLDSTTQEPPHEEVAFIQLIEEATPPPEPEPFCLTWSDDEHLIRTTGPDGPMWASVIGKFDWDVDRPFTSASGVMGSRFVTTAPPGARNLSLTAAVESEADLANLHAVLSRPLVLISPSDAEEVWAAPVSESVKIIKIGRIRQVTATFIGTGPEPAPQLADVGV